MSLAMRVRPSAVAARSVAARPAHKAVRPVRVVRLVARASPKEVEDKIAEALKEAEEVCADGTKADCAVAWDTVEELSAAASHIKASEKTAAVDPLEAFCADNPETDECRVYED